MPSAPSRFEVEHLHRLMTQASGEAARLDQRLEEAQAGYSLSPVLRCWRESAQALEKALEQGRRELQAAGTPKEQVDRIRDRLRELLETSQRFDLDADLDECVRGWSTVGLELAQLSGPQRDGLVRLLQRQKPEIDHATATLSEARRNGGVALEQQRKLAQLREERDRARAKYERLHRTYLDAQRDAQAAQQQAGAQPASQQHQVTKVPLAAVAGKPARDLYLHRLVDREHKQGSTIAVRVEKTLSQLAIAPERPLIDPRGGQLRAHLAQLDSILARLRGAGREEVLRGARDMGGIIHRMTSISAGSSNAAGFRKLIDERKAELHRIAQSQLAADLPSKDRASQAGLQAVAGKMRPPAPFGAGGLGGGLNAAMGPSHLGGFGAGHRGLGALAGAKAPLSSALEKNRDPRSGAARPPAIGTLPRTPDRATSPLREVVAKAQLKQQIAEQRAARKGPAPAQMTASALLEGVKAHPRAGQLAAHLAPGGALRQLCETAQRGHGLPIGQAAQHYLASRGSSHVWNAVQTFNTLVREGHQPRFSFGSWLKKQVSDHVSHAVGAVTQTVNRATLAAVSVAREARQGISSFGNRALDMAGRAASVVGSGVRRAAGAVGRTVGAVGRGVAQFAGKVGHGVLEAAERVGRTTLGYVRHAGHGLAQVARGGLQAAQTVGSWVARKAGAAYSWGEHQVATAANQALDRARGGAHWLGEKVHSGLEWAKKTGVVGAIGTGIKKGLSFVRKAAEHSPLGIAVRKGYGFVKSGGLTKAWHAGKDLAGKAWGLAKTAYHTTSRFLQSPAGQLLVTGLSLAASFIPGGLAVKAVIGAGIGAMQAISEGKDWKAVLASAAGGAITGAIPFLKMGPLAKLGVGALQGGITALASGGSLKDALKGAAGGAIDAFDPGAFHALKRLKSLSGAEKLFKGKKSLLSPQARKVIGGLEKLGSKGVKGGIWVSGKAARAQSVLDKVVGAGDKVHGALSQVHDLAPSLADVLGDNAAGHFVSQVGDWAGKGDDKLQKALGYGHAASDTLSKYRGYLDKGLGYAGVKDPAKAYEKMMARKDLREGKKGGLEHVARLKLEDHRRKHPELHLAEATARRPRHRPQLPRTALEKAVSRGRQLVRKGRRVAQGVHDGLGKVHDVVAKGLSGAEKVESGLEKAIALARQGAGILGEDSDLGRSLAQVADRADRVHDYLESGIGLAQDFNQKVGKAHDLIEKIPGVKKEGAEEEPPVHLEGGRKPAKASPHDAARAPQAETAQAAPAAHESEAERSARLHRAWERIGSVSRQVQKFETESAATQRKIQELLQKGQANAASIELMGLGSRCEEIALKIREAKTLARGNDKYEKEIAFYEEWHRATRAKLHAAIAGTQGLGGQVAISGFGIDEKTHPDIFANTREIYALRTKVESFAEALKDPDAREHVQKVLAEARKAKAQLQDLKAKYRKDKAASDFLSGGGLQDKLIDEVLRKLETATAGKKAEPPAPKKAEKLDVKKSVQNGLSAIDKYRKKAVKAGKRIDSGLEMAEKVLSKGIGVGRKVDSGLEKVSALAEQVSGMLGEDSELGQLAHQVSQGAGKGHEKLGQALDMAQTGKKFLHKGHQIFHQGLELAQGHHQKQLEEKEKKHHAAHQHPAPGTLEQVVEDGKHLVHDGSTLWKDGKRSVHDVQTTVKHGKRAVHDVEDLRDRLQARDWKGGFGAGKQLFADGKQLVSDGKAIFAGGKKLWSDGKHVYAEGKHLVHDVGSAVEAGWERLKGFFGGKQPAEDPAQVVQRALQCVTAFGQQVAAAAKKIEKLMHEGRAQDAAKVVESLRAMSEQTREEVARAVQAAAHDPQLSKQAASAQKHYLEVRAHVQQLAKGLQGAGAQSEAAARRERGHDTKADAPSRSGRSRRKHPDPVGELIDGILEGSDGRIHVEKRGARLDVELRDLQDVDPAAVDTWIGSGEGTKLFSEVFGAFIPAEGGTVVHHRGHRSGKHGEGKGKGGESKDAGRKRKKKGGFFADLFDHLEGFADRIGGWAKTGSKLLGKGMHYAEMGMHGLSQIEAAAEKVQGLAGKAEGFLEKMGLHRLAGYAGKIGGAAGWVDEEAKVVHGGLKTADEWMGEGKKATGEVEHGAHVAAGIFHKAGQGRFGALANLFKASRTGDGVDGKLSPDKVGLGSVFDEPRRLDVTTLSKMQSFLGGDFSGVRVHTGPGAAEVTRRFNAEAVTVKDHIFFAPGRFNPTAVEGQRLIAHELTHVLQKGRANLDVRTAEGEALHSEHSYGSSPSMETLNLQKPEPGFRLASDGEGMGASSGIHTAKRTRSRGHESGGKDALPDGEELLEQISGRVYELLMEELEHAFESR